MLPENRILIPYQEAKPLLQDADIFLFRNTAWYSWFIKRFTQGDYSHVAMVSWYNENGDRELELIEFHGFRGGGVIIAADSYFPQASNLIDVYRPSHQCDSIEYNTNTYIVESKTIPLDKKSVTHTMRKLTGMPYGWRRIWWFIKKYLVIIRLFYQEKDLTNDAIGDIIYPVCSTAVAYSFSKNNFDLIKNKADEWTTPSDISDSPRLHYLFTLV